MHPYGIAVFPQENQGRRYPARHSADGIFPVGFDITEVEAGRGHPSVMFFEREGWRDYELQELTKAYPNVMFCPITITQGFRTLPQPKATEFVISPQGVLPA